ncbi:hypothetical protein EV702DRAFT_70372 [Suillus placidus]|uniref:Secreted protein n=1 Tax=Suillus placidus TaxID=48579 RepID=A0A9P6ZGL1_9AGAM|nr:hypothetical protein EV702DRAFT_70372 [Suillus placidus]
MRRSNLKSFCASLVLSQLECSNTRVVAQGCQRFGSSAVMILSWVTESRSCGLYMCRNCRLAVSTSVYGMSSIKAPYETQCKTARHHQVARQIRQRGCHSLSCDRT